MKKWFDHLNSLQWKLVVIYLLLIIITMQLIGSYFVRSLEEEYIADLKKDLQTQASLLDSPIREKLLQKEEPNQLRNELDRLLKLLVFQRSSNMEVQITDEKGLILATTSNNKEIVGNKNIRINQIEVNQTNIRRDNITGTDYLIYKHEIKADNNVIIGTIYMEASLAKTYSTIRSISNHFIQITTLALLISALLVVILARTITNPVKEVTAQATAMASGDFDRSVDVYSQDEIGQLGSAFNHLAYHLREALTAKEEEKGKLESVLAHMSDGVIASDLQGKVIVKNQQAEQLLQRPIQIGDSLNEVLTLQKPIPLPLEEKRQKMLELYSDDPEEQVIIKAIFTPIMRQEKPIGIVAVLENATEQERLDRQRKEFVANVSHELRTPLTTIKSYLEALDDGAMEEPELASRFLQVTRQEADRMSRLINDLLQLSKLDAQQTRMQKRPLPSAPLLQQAFDRFSMPAKQKEIQITCDLADDLPQVYIDADQIDRVLDNVISNAVKYTPDKGSIKLTAYQRPDGFLVVKVSDTGIGIPKKDLQRIFERFYRVDKARSREMGGTGLGLSIAKEIIELHGGEIWIDSIYQKGTSVSFTLPPFEPEVVR
jgi:two-component system sensor histidine kinase VicK